jgi:SAM-dependent methyltransferase
MSVWVNDLRCLEAEYLAKRFRPESHGISLEMLAVAIGPASAETRDYIVTHLDTSRSRQLADSLNNLRSNSPSHVFRLQQLVMAAYMWEIIYRKYPDEYELFSQSQEFPFHRMFPSGRLVNLSVLDVGCGTGKLTAYLSRYAHNVYAIDPAEPLLAIARRKMSGTSNVTIATGTFDSVPLPDCSVDLIVSNMAFTQSAERGGHAGLRELDRVLKTGGEIQLVVGSIVTQRFLLANGFTECFVPGRIKYTIPDQIANSSVLDFMYEVSRPDPVVWSRIPPDSPKMPFSLVKRIVKCLGYLLLGVPFEDLFSSRNILRPLGIRVFSRRKA